LTATEKKLAKDILCERMERFAAVNELWEMIHNLEKKRDSGATPAGATSPLNSQKEAAGSKTEMQQMKSLIKVESDKVWKRLNALQTEGQRIERQLKLLEADVKNGTEVLKSNGAAGTVDPASLPAMPRSVGQTQDASALERSVQTLEERMNEQAAEVSGVCQMLTESRLLLPLQAIRACRMALRVSTLDDKQREETKQALAAQEAAIRSKVTAAVGENNGAFELPLGLAI